MQYVVEVVRIFVADFERALEFYTRVLGISTTFVTDGWAELATGATRLALERVAPNNPESSGLLGRFVGVSLRVDDVAAAHRELTARGVVFVAPPERQPWGGLLAHFEDCERNTLTLLGS